MRLSAARRTISLSARRPAILLSCEHGGNGIPAVSRSVPWLARATQQPPRLRHRALACARALSAAWRTPLIHAEVSRLLVDLNRSPHHPALFSALTRALPAPERMLILQRHYFPHRQRIERWIAARIRGGRAVVHVAVHSFTPVLDGHKRDADIGLLYDPAREWERLICRRWQTALQQESGLRVRRNYPYRGTSDGLTRHLRERFSAHDYAGIELEINQGTHCTDGAPRSSPH